MWGWNFVWVTLYCGLQLILSKIFRNGDIVYTVDHEIGPWKMASFHGMTWWSNFHGPIPQKINLQSLWTPH